MKLVKKTGNKKRQNEESKFDFSPNNAIDLVKQVAQLKTLKIKGLMTIGLFSAETEKVSKCFRLLKEIQEQIISLKIPNVEMQELSMGMSSDLVTAIAEGATIVRIGYSNLWRKNSPQ